MNGFFEYFESKGIKDMGDLTRFVHNFLRDPSIFFYLTEVERDGMEKKLDDALAVIKIEHEENNNRGDR